MPTLTTDTALMAEQVAQSHLRHVAIIMDGNRRWAKAQGLSTLAGHQAGVTALRNLVRYASDIGIEALTVYAFSTENWKRTPEEVEGLMQLFIYTMQQELEGLQENGVQVRYIGDFSAFSPALQAEIATMTQETAANTGLKFQIALNYGSRSEILHATRQLCHQVAAGTLNPDDIDDTQFESALYTHGLPDLDLLIRTGGEYRISNYLLWQAAYAEIYVTEILWPEFTIEAFNQAVITFSQRQRRFGQ